MQERRTHITRQQEKTAKHPLVLSLFPGIGLLDRAFEEQGFCVVRGPDILWGGDIKTFHPPANVFAGVIGGPPCQPFSRLKFFVKYHGYKEAENLIPEFERCVFEVQPTWFLMENVPLSPLPEVRGYTVHTQVVNNRWFGGVQQRTRKISFGTQDGKQLLLTKLPERAAYAPAVTASGGIKPGTSLIKSPKGNELGYHSQQALKEMIQLQGLPDTFSLPTFTVEGAMRVVGNGVPLPLGRAIARAIADLFISQ